MIPLAILISLFPVRARNDTRDPAGLAEQAIFSAQFFTVEPRLIQHESCLSGMVKWNIDPAPGVDSTQILPP